jgi:hypothetical protein
VQVRERRGAAGAAPERTSAAIPSVPLFWTSKQKGGGREAPIGAKIGPERDI